MHALAGERAQSRNAEARSYVGCELLIPPTYCLRLGGARFQRLDVCDRLYEERLILRSARELFVQTPAKRRHRAGHQEHVAGNRR